MCKKKYMEKCVCLHSVRGRICRMNEGIIARSLEHNKKALANIFASAFLFLRSLKDLNLGPSD